PLTKCRVLAPETTKLRKLRHFDPQVRLRRVHDELAGDRLSLVDPRFAEVRDKPHRRHGRRRATERAARDYERRQSYHGFPWEGAALFLPRCWRSRIRCSSAARRSNMRFFWASLKLCPLNCCGRPRSWGAFGSPSPSPACC